MKRIFCTLALSFAAAGMAAADPIEGTWQTQPDDGSYAYVEIAPCGEGYCGTISRSFDSDGEYDSPNIGRRIVRDMVPQGGGAYEGRVWRPSNDKVYLGKIDISGDTMRLRGCIAGGLFCAKQTWKKLP